MPKKRSPSRDKAFEIYREYKGNIDLVKIAEILKLSSGTIRGWKNKDQWDNKLNGTFRKKCNKNTERSEKNKINKPSFKGEAEQGNNTAPIIDELTERQRLFAEIFVRTPIAYKAAIKAGYSSNCAFMEGSRLMRNDKVRTYIDYLKQLKRASILLNEEDIVDIYMRIAFSDITDYAEFGRERIPVLVKGMPIFKKNEITGEKEPITKWVNSIRLKEDFEVDGALINEISSGREGVKIKLHDKQKALEWLTNYFEMNPLDKHKKDYDKAKLKIEEEKLNLAHEKLDMDKSKDKNNDKPIEIIIKRKSLE